MKYFDYAATCPLDEDAAQIYVKTATNYFGNSQSLHDIGEQARRLLENCRDEFAGMLAVPRDGVFFTSGGSESNFLAIEALLSSTDRKRKHIITNIAEHSSVHSTLERLKATGYRVTYLPFNQHGVIDVSQFEAEICEDTALAVIQHANSEIGTIQPIVEIGKLCKQHNILLHSDCVQTFGKIDLKPITSYVDSLSFSGHKFYGPKGIGAAYLKPQIAWLPSFPKTTHESGFRPGTVNVPAIAAMTVAAKKINQSLKQNQLDFLKKRNLLLDALKPIQDCVVVHGSPEENQLSHIIGLSFKGVEGQWVLNECNHKGFAISTGSACHTGLLTPASSMVALGYTGKIAKEFFRISFGRDTAGDDIVKLGKALVSIYRNHSSGI